jgi:peptide deformylase
MSRSKNVWKIVTDERDLSDRCDEVNAIADPAHVTSVVNDLKDTLRDNDGLIALAAPQIGVKERIFCIRFSDGEIKSFVNPMVTKIQGKFLMIEKDVVDGKEYMVQRPDRAMVGYQTPAGKAETDKVLNNPLSAVFEHMVDVLDGTAHYKHLALGIEIGDDYYKAPKGQKEELNEWYINTYLPAKVAELKAVADGDEDIQRTQKAIDFMESVWEGKTEVVPSNAEGDLDFEHSSTKMVEEHEAIRKEHEARVKKKYGIA